MRQLILMAIKAGVSNSRGRDALEGSNHSFLFVPHCSLNDQWGRVPPSSPLPPPQHNSGPMAFLVSRNYLIL